jgi:hypothetical protein
MIISITIIIKYIYNRNTIIDNLYKLDNVKYAYNLITILLRNMLKIIVSNNLIFS